MKERIQELWYKAAESTAAFPSGQNNSWETQVNFMEKFAELIVRECIGIVENLSPGYADYRNQIEDAFRRDCVEKVKEHFGVE